MCIAYGIRENIVNKIVKRFYMTEKNPKIDIIQNIHREPPD